MKEAEMFSRGSRKSGTRPLLFWDTPNYFGDTRLKGIR